MNLTQRIQTAIREEGNIVVLAGFAALSIALLNPVPLLIAMVAETAYLLYVPDSRWYANRLSTRYDNEVKRRRAELKRGSFADAPPETVQIAEMQESLREGIGRRASDATEWLVFLRRLDYLLELQIQNGGTIALINTRTRRYSWTSGDNLDPLSAGAARIAYYDSTLEALRSVAQNTPGNKQPVAQASIAHVEEQKSETQKELFQVVAAQHLMDSAYKTTKEASNFLQAVHDAGDTVFQSRWGEDVLRIIKECEANLRRSEDWLKQAK